MLITYKTEINPTEDQIEKINKIFGVCRYIYNFYISENIQSYREGKGFITAFTFSKWLNNEFIPNNKDKKWIKEVYAKATKQAIINGERAFRRFFKEKKGFPKFKKKGKSKNSFYFVKEGKTGCTVERHRIKIPTLGFVRLKEKGYIPTNAVIKSGTISRQANRYFVSVLVDIDKDLKRDNNNIIQGIGVDLGIKDFANVSDGRIFGNINKTKKVIRLEKRLVREQRRLSRKYEFKKRTGNISCKNIEKQKGKVQKIHYLLWCIRTDYINKIVNDLVKTKPSYITIEDLNVSGMMKNRHLSKAISKQKFYDFRVKLINKAKQNDIEVRLVNRFYTSSKLCSECGFIKQDLKLKDRIYKCENCNLEIDRDFNASLNLRGCKEYKIA